MKAAAAEKLSSLLQWSKSTPREVFRKLTSQARKIKIPSALHHRYVIPKRFRQHFGLMKGFHYRGAVFGAARWVGHPSQAPRAATMRELLRLPRPLREAIKTPRGQWNLIQGAKKASPLRWRQLLKKSHPVLYARMAKAAKYGYGASSIGIVGWSIHDVVAEVEELKAPKFFNVTLDPESVQDLFIAPDADFQRSSPWQPNYNMTGLLFRPASAWNAPDKRPTIPYVASNSPQVSIMNSVSTDGLSALMQDFLQVIDRKLAEFDLLRGPPSRPLATVDQDPIQTPALPNTHVFPSPTDLPGQVSPVPLPAPNASYPEMSVQTFRGPDFDPLRPMTWSQPKVHSFDDSVMRLLASALSFTTSASPALASRSTFVLLLSLLLSLSTGAAAHTPTLAFQGYDCARIYDVSLHNLGEMSDFCRHHVRDEFLPHDNRTFRVFRKVKALRVPAFRCRLRETVLPMACGSGGGASSMLHLISFAVPKPVSPAVCRTWHRTLTYTDARGWDALLIANTTTVLRSEAVGRTWTEGSDTYCLGEEYTFRGETYQHMLIVQQLEIELLQDTLLLHPDGSIKSETTGSTLNCPFADGHCVLDDHVYSWTPFDPDHACWAFSVYNASGVFTDSFSHAKGPSTFVSTDGSRISVSLQTPQVSLCGAVVWATSDPSTFLADSIPANSQLQRPLPVADKSPLDDLNRTATHVEDNVMRLVQNSRRALRQSICQHWSDQFDALQTELSSIVPPLLDGSTTSLGQGRFQTLSGEAVYKFSCEPMTVHAVQTQGCFNGLPIRLRNEDVRHSGGREDTTRISGRTRKSKHGESANFCTWNHGRGGSHR